MYVFRTVQSGHSSSAKRRAVGTGWLSQYRLYCGKNQPVYWRLQHHSIYWPSVARSIAPPRLVRGARWRRRRSPQKSAFSLHFASQLGLHTVALAGRGYGHQQKKIKKKSREITNATCGDDVTLFMCLVFAQVQCKSFWRVIASFTRIVFLDPPGDPSKKSLSSPHFRVCTSFYPYPKRRLDVELAPSAKSTPY